MAFIIDDKYTCLDPDDVLAHCLRDGLRYDHFYGQANHFSNRLGGNPGTGKLLVSYDTLSRLKIDTALEAAHTLTIHDHNNLPLPKINDIVFVDHELAVTPGFEGDPNAAYLVTIADARHRWYNRGAPITAMFNVRSDRDGHYFTESLNAGVAWTYTTMLNQLWTLGGLTVFGAVPTLPFTPDGIPEGWIFHRDYPLNAIDYFLIKLCCVLKYNQTSNGFTIVRMGDTDDASYAASATFGTTYRSKLRYDYYPVTGLQASFPEKLRIEFRATPPIATFARHPYYEEDRTVEGARTTGNYLNLQDDLYALIDSNGGISAGNLSLLDARADERALHWTAKRRYHDVGAYREYGGFYDFQSALGTPWSSVVWEDRGGNLPSGEARGLLTCIRTGFNENRHVEDWAWRLPPEEYFDPCCPGHLGGVDGDGCCDHIDAPPCCDCDCDDPPPDPEGGGDGCKTWPGACDTPVVIINGEEWHYGSIGGQGGGFGYWRCDKNGVVIPSPGGPEPGNPNWTSAGGATPDCYWLWSGGGVWPAPSPKDFDLVDGGVDGETADDWALAFSTDPTTAGLPVVKGSSDLTGQTAGSTAVSYTPTADGTFLVSAYLTITANTGTVLTVTASWTDPAGGGASAPMSPLSGTLGSGVTGEVTFAAFPVRAQTGGAIAVTIGGVIGTVSYSAGGRIIQL